VIHYFQDFAVTPATSGQYRILFHQSICWGRGGAFGYNNYLIISLPTFNMLFEDMKEKIFKLLNYFLNNKILLIFLFCMLIYNINFHPIPSYDTLPARLLPWNIYENHNLYLDKFAESQTGGTPAEFLEETGHYLSPFPMVMPILITPLVSVPYLILKLMNIPIALDNSTFVIVSLMTEKVIASLIASLSVVILYITLKKLFSEKTALLCSLIYAFATCTWVISSQALWQHGMAELLLCLILLTIFMILEKDSWNLYIILGVLSALYALNRPPDLIFLIPVFIFVLFSKNIRIIISYLISLSLAATPFILYNFVYFGSVFGGYNQNAALLQISPSIFVAFAGYMISPNRGLLFLSPVLIFSFLGVWLVLKNKITVNPTIKTLLLLFALCIPVNLFIYCSFPEWWGGQSFGYRYLVDLLPFFAVFLGFAIEYLWSRKSSLASGLKIIFVIFVIWSVLVQVCGAFYYYYDWDMKNSQHDSVNSDPARIWNVSDLQFVYGVYENPNPYSLLLHKLRENRNSSFNLTSSQS
jgi:Dolichyl-phosphate-mannose-protein mannosyltransferase